MMLVPDFMRRRPLDRNNRPVPWFVTKQHEDGQWDFTHIAPERVEEALRRRLCWVSGEPLGKYTTFIVDPRDVFLRCTQEPGCKKKVAEWAVKTCPYLLGQITRPARSAGRNGMGQDRVADVVLYTTTEWNVDGALIRLGEPTALSVWAEGQLGKIDFTATSLEILKAAPSKVETVTHRLKQANELLEAAA